VVGLAGERERDEPEQVDDEDEDQKRRAVGEPRGHRLRRKARFCNLRLRDVVDHLAEGLPRPGDDGELPPHETEAEEDRDQRPEEQVHDRAIDRHVDRAEVDRHPVLELELVGRVEGLGGRGGGRDQGKPSQRGDESPQAHPHVLPASPP
jgi:hypothetical protein